MTLELATTLPLRIQGKVNTVLTQSIFLNFKQCVNKVLKVTNWAKILKE